MRACLFAFCAVSAAGLLAANPDWTLFLERADGTRPVAVSGLKQSCTEERPSAGVCRHVYTSLTDGASTYAVKVVVESRDAAGETSWRGRIENNAGGIRVTGFEGPYFTATAVTPDRATLYIPQGLGRRIGHFPLKPNDPKIRPLPDPSARKKTNWVGGSWFRLEDGSYTFDTGRHPGAAGLTMPWAALDTGVGTLYVGAHDPKALPKRVRLRWDAKTRRAVPAFDHRFFLPAGGAYDIPETVCAEVAGDWHAAARRYRAWYDTVREIRTATPAWTREIAGWLLVIMKQQNEELMWPYTDIPKLCDVAQRNGLDCIGLFGWTVGGHDHLYPDYDPDPKMGGVPALKAGIAEAHRRGIKVYIYANGQLQQIGATAFWNRYGKDLALVNKDGSLVIQTYHKYADLPKYEFALGCLYGRPWYDRMYALAEQANGFGADGILYDQLGVFAPFACYGKGHGHPSPDFSYSVERPAFIRRIADTIQKRNPQFAVLTEGLHDTILDSIGIFHGCEYGAFLNDMRSVRTRVSNAKAESFPELWHYTFPELVSTLRFPAPMCVPAFANFAAVFGYRHEIEIRYAPDRVYVLEDKVPVKADYGTVNNIPDLKMMAQFPPAEASAYLKGVCDFQRAEAKYLLKGRFLDTDGFACTNPALVAKRFLAEDGTSAVLVWNISEQATSVEIDGLGTATAVKAPAVAAADGPLAANAIRLYTYAK